MNQVGRLKQHHAAVAGPSQTGAHIGGHHIKCLSILAAQDVWVTHALGECDRVAGDDGIAVVERGIVVAIVAEGIADLLVLRSIAVEISEEISHHLVRVFLNLSDSLFLGGCGGDADPCTKQERQQEH